MTYIPQRLREAARACAREKACLIPLRGAAIVTGFAFARPGRGGTRAAVMLGDRHPRPLDAVRAILPHLTPPAEGYECHGITLDPQTLAVRSAEEF